MPAGYVLGMGWKRIASWQRDELIEQAKSHHQFYIKLRERMDRIGWERSDPTYRAVVAAIAAAGELVRAAEKTESLEECGSVNSTSVY